MKKEIIKTSRGRFLLIDSRDAPSSFNRYLRDIEDKFGVQLTTGYKVSEITEEEASGIVDEPVKFFNPTNPYCVEDVVYINYNSGKGFWTAIESLHSLLESKGIHLFRNPYLDFETLNIDAIEAEENTFKNPYIFKI